MSLILLDTVRTADDWYGHAINTDDDSTIFYKGSEGSENPRFYVDSSAYVYDGSRKRIGKFELTHHGTWDYHSADGLDIIRTACGDLLRAEVKVFRILA